MSLNRGIYLLNEDKCKCFLKLGCCGFFFFGRGEGLEVCLADFLYFRKITAFLQATWSNQPNLMAWSWFLWQTFLLCLCRCVSLVGCMGWDGHFSEHVSATCRGDTACSTWWHTSTSRGLAVSGSRGSVTFASCTSMLVLPSLGMELDSRERYVTQATAWHSTMADMSLRV